jgi:hypothetical protein
MERIEPTVAEASPNLYAAAKNANLSPTETTQINQLSYALKEHRRLSKLSADTAKQQFVKLDKDAQDGLKFLFKNAEYLKEDPSILDRTFGVVKNVAKGFASPLIEMYNAAAGYGRAINTPYLVGRQVQQGQGTILNKKVWANAWDGKALYDDGAIKKAKEYFGDTDTVVAQGLLAGKTPGEIIQSYGTPDEKILASITKAYNKPDEFKQVMDGVKYAQLSPGRDLARMMDDVPVRSGGLHGDYISGKTKNISGVTDFIYQIAVDPMTWLTGGTSKGATLGERLATSVTDAAQRGELNLGVREVMAKPEVFNLWEKQLGPAIKKYADAKSAAEKTLAYRELIDVSPGYRNREAINTFARNNVVDAASAEKFFSHPKNVNLMLSGRIDGVDYYRNGIAVAKTHRNMADGLSSYLDGVFNSTTAKQLGPLSTRGRTVEQLEAQGEDIYSAFAQSGDALDVMTGAMKSKVLTDAIDELKGFKNITKKIGTMGSRSPINLEIRLGAEADKTAENFTAKARLLLPRDFAEFMTTKFLDSTEDEQVVIMRNMDAAIMLKAGLGGEPDGRILMNKILADKYGGKSGMGVVSNLEVNPEHAKFLDETTMRNENGVPMVQSMGAIQPFQEAKAIGALPYAEIAAMANQIRSKKNLFYAIGGIPASETARKITDIWSLLTLFPRLGIRSAIDEGLAYALTAPGKDLFHFAARTGARLGKVSTAFTGSKAAVGPIKSGLLKIVGKAPQDAIGLEKRAEIMRTLADKLGVPVEQLNNIQKREAIGEEVLKIYGRFINKEDQGYLMQALIHQPEMLNSVANSLVAQSGLSGKYSKEIIDGIVDMSALSKHLSDLKLERGTKAYSISTNDLAIANQAWLTAAHHENWFLSFVANRKELPNNRVIDPGYVFYTNEGLRPGGVDSATGKEYFQNALDQLSEAAGLSYNVQTNMWYVFDQAAVDSFKAMSSRTVDLKARGIDDVGIVRDQMGRILADLYTTFHGSSKGYNQELFNAVRSEFLKFQELEVSTGSRVGRKWAKASASIPYERFAELTVGHQPVGEINTAINFPGFSDIEGAYRAFGNKLMEGMDRQMNALFRQPAVMVTYTQLRKQYSGIERAFIKQSYDAHIAENPAMYISEKSKSRLLTQMEALGQKRFTEIASRDAIDKVLMFADNPAIRSNAAFSARTVGRYYRATEDFQRRIWRMTKVAPRVLYRLRLAHQGLDATGEVHPDQNGDPYIIMPMDKIIYKATDTTLRALTGDGYRQPAFSDFTIKLKLVNPSFQQDAGLPTLAGPMAGLSVIGIKNLLGSTDNPFLTKVGEQLDTIALGNIGDNLDVTRAVMPSTLTKLWSLLPVNEKTRQEVTAGQQAMAYMAAHGQYLDANSTAEEKTAYLKNLRISAHNIVALRSVLGLISPVAPTIQESLDVPNYLKNAKITGLRPEFFDILNGITAANQGDIQDPYGLALATFMGKNPGKLIYTVSRTDKATKVVVKNTEGLKNWAIDNNNLIKTYGEAAYIFAPQVGKFTPASYNWIQASGLMTNKTLEKYYDDILVAQDKQSYYNIATQEKEMLSNVADPNARSIIIKQAESARASLKASNPLLTKALIGSGNNIGDEVNMMAKVEQIILDPKTNVDAGTRSRMGLAIKMIKEFMAFAQDPRFSDAINGIDIKRERKAQVEANIKDLMAGDLYVTEANRAIFQSILDSLSRDSYISFNRRS